MTHLIIPTTEPFFLPGKSKVGVLLTHGFTGTPKEMRWMGNYLNREAGFTCLGPRLAGHATFPADMARTHYEDWMASLEDGYNLLSGVADHIYLCGLSMGGSLSLMAASYLPVRGVIAMATPYELPEDWRINFTDQIAFFKPYLPKSTEAPGTGWFDKTAFQEHISYPRNPIRAIGQLKRLLASLREALPKITVPTLLINSADDHYLPLGSQESMEYIYTHLGATQKQKLLIHGSGHVLPRDAQRETVFQAAIQFIQQVEANQP